VTKPNKAGLDFSFILEEFLEITEEEAALLASFTVNKPKTTSESPPIRKIVEMRLESKNEAAPWKMSMQSISSTSICPRKTSGPEVQPFLRESSIVAKSIGPGTRAPVSPTVKPMRRNLKISIASIVTKAYIDLLKTLAINKKYA
jgi:hypothetical protein